MPEAVLGARSRARRGRAPRRPPPRGRAARRDVAAQRRPARAASRSSRSSWRTSGSARRTGGRSRVSRSRAVAAACRSTVQSVSASANCGARAITVPSWSITTEWPSKTSSSCPPTRLQNATALRLSRARWIEHRLALAALAREVRGGRGVDDQRRARERLLGRRMARRPDVLADRQPDAEVAEVEHDRVVAGLEVALLVEDAVVRQQRLAVDGMDRPSDEHGERVVDVVGALGEADERDDALRGAARARRARPARRRGSAP